MSADPDRDLVDRARAGERAAFEALLRRHYDRMHRIAWRLTGSAHDAEDIVQDVCCALVRKIDSFKGDAKFTTWLFGIVVNACRDHRRRGATLARLKMSLSVLVGLASPTDGRELHLRTCWEELAARTRLARYRGARGGGGPDPWRGGMGARRRGGDRLMADARSAPPARA